MDYSIKIGGEAGQGIQTVGDTLAKVFSRNGYYVFACQDYESRIRGGHNYYQIRFSDKQVMAARDKVNVILAFDNESMLLHNELDRDGVMIYDSSMLQRKYEGANAIDIPFSKLAIEHGGNKIMENTVAIGAILGLLGIELDILKDIIRKVFAKKGEGVVQANANAAMAGHDFCVNQCPRCSFSIAPVSGPKLLSSGNDALGFGVVASGCKFYSAYPMTPSTSIMTYVIGKAEQYGIVVEQAEDEISAINMALGASYAGVRAMTGSSGGGFALMVEGLSLAGMIEIPLVVALAQRPGPATGFPTRTEQGELLFALYCGHGEFPRVILAPGTPEQAFYLAAKAFDLAEKYQVPVIILTDQHLADSQFACDGFDLNKMIYNDYRLRGDAFSKLAGYKRFAFTESGVSPLGVPGDAGHVVVVDSDEHDEEGHIVEDADTRIKMVNKRFFKKLSLIKREIDPPVFYGSENPDVVIAGWGSQYGAMKEAVDALSAAGKIAMLHFSELYPFPSTEKFDYMGVLRNARVSICVEQNATGQFARLMRSETGFEFAAHINRYDGRPFSADKLAGEINARIG